ncbi:MAG TPA: cupin domain-containing protein [Pirellulales bacterium]|nr:cupin domain-containing protein [Pirellulales bacterium]
MSEAYTHIADLAKTIEPPADGTLSRTLFDDERVKVVVFGFSAGQELSEHTSSKPAILHVLSGNARLTLGADAVAAGPGAWTWMPAGLPHSVKAETPVVMLLTLLK